MDTEHFILSVRDRRQVWDQRLPEHHNRFVLGKLWKGIAKENNCSVTVVQKKWKGLRDYYRSEFRKTQKERSGQEADAIYKSNWPFFTTMDFLREQFLERPSSGNIKLSTKGAGIRKSDLAGITEVSDIINNPVPLANFHDKNFDIDESVSEIPAVASCSAENETGVVTKRMQSTTNQKENRTFTHSNEFQSQKLLEIKQKKFQLLEEKKRNQEEEIKELNYTVDEDLKFFESLKPHLKLITGYNKLMFRNDVHNLVLKYAYFSGEDPTHTSLSDQSGLASGSVSRVPTPQPRCEMQNDDNAGDHDIQSQFWTPSHKHL